MNCIYVTECVDSFTDKSKTSSDGGEIQDGIDDLDECKAACLDEDDCLGFDWTLDENADNRCWLHSDSDKFEDNKDNSNSDQYTRKDCEEAEPTGKAKDVNLLHKSLGI